MAPDRERADVNVIRRVVTGIESDGSNSVRWVDRSNRHSRAFGTRAEAGRAYQVVHWYTLQRNTFGLLRRFLFRF